MPQSREIRIAHVTYALHVGGMENCIFRIGTSLLGAGFKVEVITTEDQGEWFGRPAGLNLRARYIPRLKSGIPRVPYPSAYVGMILGGQMMVIGFRVISKN